MVREAILFARLSRILIGDLHVKEGRVSLPSNLEGTQKTNQCCAGGSYGSTATHIAQQPTTAAPPE